MHDKVSAKVKFGRAQEYDKNQLRCIVAFKTYIEEMRVYTDSYRGNSSSNFKKKQTTC